jgi:hypothetical protein
MFKCKLLGYTLTRPVFAAEECGKTTSVRNDVESPCRACPDEKQVSKNEPRQRQQGAGVIGRGGDPPPPSDLPTPAAAFVALEKNKEDLKPGCDASPMGGGSCPRRFCGRRERGRTLLCHQAHQRALSIIITGQGVRGGITLCLIGLFRCSALLTHGGSVVCGRTKNAYDSSSLPRRPQNVGTHDASCTDQRKNESQGREREFLITIVKLASKFIVNQSRNQTSDGQLEGQTKEGKRKR